MKIISIVGNKNSGKTSLSIKIIKELKSRGYKVATIKDSHHKMEMDKENTDTWRHKEAGSEIVVGIGETTFFNIRERLSLERMLFLIKLIDEPDFVVIEGFKKYNYAKIATTEDVVDDYTIELVDSFNITDDEIKTLANKIETNSYDITDTLFINDCGFNDGDSIAKGIINNEINSDNLDNVNVSLSIDGKVIGLNKFVSNFMEESIVGMLKSLKTSEYGVEKEEKIEIIIKRK
ncbi:molybdopterin-guanine dinucleotide biosynthesis protein B [Methanobrevibacter sp. OttesenSCG-928-K11]|nr:molybdopterin-guanine dinucleotide biosynthesis protein B [Methanobrevibacter sp. OttesenSCG-928-K11]MDL2270637.1 molybdopterin-guanine dinucleotide biosynthesis protein B [Methanobrevibacter sp. OttesenSCG-928-I08]